MDEPGELNSFTLQPRGKSSLSTYIAEQFRLSDFSITPLRNDPRSTVAKVADKTSGPLILYCLKNHMRGKTAQRIEAQHDAVTKVRSAGFHLLPSPVRTVSGATVINADARLWSMYDFVESRPSFDWTYCQWGVEEASSAGRHLAMFHSASGKVKPETLDVGSAAVLDNVETWLRAAVGKLAAAVSDSFTLREPLTTSLFDNLSDLVRELRLMERSDVVLLHGDYHPGNLLYKTATEVAALVDYDDLQLGERVQDIAYGALTFALSTEKEEAAARDQSVVDEERLNAFLKAYEEQWRRKSEQEAWKADALAGWIRLSAFLIIYWCLDRMSESKDNVSLYRGAVELAVRVATGTCATTSKQVVSTRC